MNTTERAPGPETPALEFRHVHLSFEGKPALVDVSFRLARGQMIVITGASQSGKSVLLRLAIGLQRPDSGQIVIEGRPVEKLDETELLAIRKMLMGIAFQEDALFTALSVYENAAYRLREHDWPEDELDRAVREILAFVGLDQHIEKLPEELSIGMRRRLEIARALVGWPPIMLFDEPASGLDPLNARMIMDLIIRAHELHRISMLCVTKEMHEIRYLARHHVHRDRDGLLRIAQGEALEIPQTQTTVLEDGRIVFLGGIDDFDSSMLPAVRHLTVPPPEAATAKRTPADPWSRKPGAKTDHVTVGARPPDAVG